MQDHDHLSRQDYHRRLAGTLASAPVAHPWACVVGFYAAFHSARWALQCDRRFDDEDTLEAIHPHLRPNDRRPAKHKARRGPGPMADFGVNDLVLLLYPKASKSYELLHQASIEVRYNQGRLHLLPGAEQMIAMVDEVHAEVAAVIMAK